MNLRIKIRKIYYKLFGKLIFYREMRRRRLINKKRKEYKLVSEFRKLENALRQIKYPKNNFNKIMSMVLSDIVLFGHVVKGYDYHRKLLKNKTLDDKFYIWLEPRAKSYPMHPKENDINNAIKVDVQSLFIFGTILVNRSLLLLKMYFSDRHNSRNRNIYSGIGYFYPVLSDKKAKFSPLLRKFKKKYLLKVKWLYSVLRFYRNEFIEHLDKGYQRGMTFSVYTDGFSLSSYKWNYNDNDNKKIEKLKSKLEKNKIHIGGREDGGRNLKNRYYLQRVFDNIVKVPDDLLKETLELIEEVGGESPQPSKVIREIEEYVMDLFQFMIDELDSSELFKYKVKN